jgi:Ni,Fe-hydrogenase III small subunit/Pyruvate/2-oxoacid:ferredoxin oxidoreductase delta subunit
MSGFKSLRVRVAQGTPYITDLRKAAPTGFRGRPTITREPCVPDCNACQSACPTGAIRLQPVALDLGRCVFCNACAEICPAKKFDFTSEPRMAGREPSDLMIEEGAEAATRVRASATFARLFGRSLKMRQVSAGGCNACELELGALANVNFDVQRYGIEWVASPRHADALVLTGPLTRTMQAAVRLAWDAMPEPRFLVAVGACAISGGLYAGADGVDRSFLEEVGPVLYVAGCPPHPLTIINAILDLLGAD